MEKRSYKNEIESSRLRNIERTIERNTNFARAVYVVNRLLRDSGIGTASFYRTGEIGKSRGKYRNE